MVIKLKALFFILISGLLVSTLSWGAEVYEFYHGTRAMAMGNAFVAVADDEQAVFLNPAGLAGIKNTEFTLLTADLISSYDIVLSALSGYSAISGITGKEGADLSDVVMGKNIYGRAQLTSTLVMPYFGLGFIVDSQVGLSSVNRVLPKINLGYMTTNGVQASFGAPIWKNFRKKGELRIGIGGKYLFRRGGFRTLKTVETVNLTRAKLSQITGPYGTGIGVDVGSQYYFRASNHLSFSLGCVYTDIGDTNFGAKPMPIKGNLATGGMVKYTLGKSAVSFSYDYKHILEKTDWRKKNHFGLEVSLPMVKLWGGINQVFVTYGAAVDLWLFKVSGISYAVEHGSFVHINPERRYEAQIVTTFEL